MSMGCAIDAVMSLHIKGDGAPMSQARLGLVIRAQAPGHDKPKNNPFHIKRSPAGWSRVSYFVAGFRKGSLAHVQI